MKNLCKYTIFLPIIMLGTILLGLFCFGGWAFGSKDIVETLKEDIKAMWRPTK